MNIYHFIDYKKFFNTWLKNSPKKGHGISVKIAEHLDLSPVMISQIFKGTKNISTEHAYLLCEFLNMTTEETKYFLLLVQYEKASNHKLKHFLKIEIDKIQQQKKDNLKEIIPEDIHLTEADKAIFYSSWQYSAIRLLTSIDGFQTIEKISQKLNIPANVVQKKMQFLLEKKLCLQSPKGFSIGPQRTHLEASSPYIMPRQISWRTKGFEKMEEKNNDYLFYTAPMSISNVQFNELKSKISDLILELNKNIVHAQGEKLSCLNIDLFDI